MDNKEVIFSVNPGSTSTKCSIYLIAGKEISEIISENIEHTEKELSPFGSVADQISLREEIVSGFLNRNMKNEWKVAACSGRGGMLTPVPSGVIKVNKELVDFSLYTPVYEHASNLGAPLAYSASLKYGCPAFISDPVAVDEFSDIARLSGSPQFPRFSFVHALNVRAVVRKLSEEISVPFDKIKCVVAHLGAGFSIAAFDSGRIVDNDNRMESAAFTPERAGGLPPVPLIDACYSGKYTKEEMMDFVYGRGGVYAYLGTKDIKKAAADAKNGDKKAELVINAMIYQISKEIAAMASVLKFETDGIILTGGLAYSEDIVSGISERVGKAGRIFVYPGSSENGSLARNALRVLKGDEKAMTWPVEVRKKDIL